MNCPICHTYNKNAAIFCNDCGFNFKKQKQINSTDINYLKPYTPEFSTDNHSTSLFSIEGERKFVTVLFTEISNYLFLTEKLSPEDVHQIMDGFFHILLKVIHKYQGTINQFTGNGIIAMFGAPSTIENHALNSCLAALAAQSAVNNYAKKMGSSLELSRTYFEVGKRLFEGKSNFGELNKVKRKDYLLKARTAFKAMDLQQDMKDLESYTAFNNIDL
ncbi:MAG: adenylate/guanylate cyclase domain-containing protein [Deltaproteobacteria bacterium]|nr:adenylate/guanylate cyclase domain-containing protein [Deltaproteobacteria bacterium]